MQLPSQGLVSKVTSGDKAPRRALHTEYADELGHSEYCTNGQEDRLKPSILSPPPLLGGIGGVATSLMILLWHMASKMQNPRERLFTSNQARTASAGKGKERRRVPETHFGNLLRCRPPTMAQVPTSSTITYQYSLTTTRSHMTPDGAVSRPLTPATPTPRRGQDVPAAGDKGGC